MTDQIIDQPPGATDLDDVSDLLLDITTRSELNDAEAVNQLAAYDWLGVGRVGDVFTVRFYRELHTKMFDQVWGWAGALRTQTQNEVGGPFTPAADVARRLGEVAYQANQNWQAHENAGETAVLPFIAQYHHALVQVHPFNNGNGRWSRLTADAVLIILAKQRNLIWASNPLELEVDSKERETYIIALRAADQGDLEPLLLYLQQLNPGRE